MTRKIRTVNLFLKKLVYLRERECPSKRWEGESIFDQDCVNKKDKDNSRTYQMADSETKLGGLLRTKIEVRKLHTRSYQIVISI